MEYRGQTRTRCLDRREAHYALNQEVRQGSCEWLCHSWDAGSESRHVMRTLPPERWST